jgi:hypothetical protein
MELITKVGLFSQFIISRLIAHIQMWTSMHRISEAESKNKSSLFIFCPQENLGHYGKDAQQAQI